MTDPSDSAPLHGYPHQEIAQNPEGRHVPEHDRPVTVEMPEEELTLRLKISHLEKVERHPSSDPVYQQLRERLTAIEAMKEKAQVIYARDEFAREDQKKIAELTAQRDALLAERIPKSFTRETATIAELNERRQYMSPREFAIVEQASSEIKELTAQRDALLAACQLALKAIDESYEATGFFRVGHTLTERIAIEAAIAACQATTESEGDSNAN